MYATFPSAPPISWLTQYEFVDMIGAQNLWELHLGQPWRIWKAWRSLTWATTDIVWDNCVFPHPEDINTVVPSEAPPGLRTEFSIDLESILA